MDKVLKILVVFALLMLLILFSIRTRRFREYSLSRQIPDTPPTTDETELLSSVISHQGIAIVTDESTGLIYQYNTQGILSIYHIHGSKELQRLAVPPDAYYLSIDPVRDEIHLHHDGEIYVYARQ